MAQYFQTFFGVLCHNLEDCVFLEACRKVTQYAIDLRRNKCD